MNIFSGEPGLAGALTNPTELSRKKGSIQQRYPVIFDNKTYPDAEAAYHALSTGNQQEDDVLCADIIAAKLLQHPQLLTAITKRGGTVFLKQCTHYTNAKSEHAKAWEGAGMESRFIRVLVAGYEQALRGEIGRQPSLF